jgi:hypothetical protein
MFASSRLTITNNNMTTAQIIESVKAIRNQIFIIQNQLDSSEFDEKLGHAFGQVADNSVESALFDAQEALANVLTMIEPNPYL